MALLDRTKKLLSVSAYSGKNTLNTSLSDKQVEKLREALGGNLLPPIQNKLEWFPQEIDNAVHLADLGNLTLCGRLKRYLMKFPLVNGLSSTKYGGITRLPKKWFGSEQVIDSLLSKDGGIPRFDLLCPPSELRAMAEDADTTGVACGELLPVEGRPYKVLQRLDVEYIMYRWPDNTYHARTIAGLQQITPGDGHWVLHIQGPRVSPWSTAKIWGLGKAACRLDSCEHLQQNYSFKLANAARVAVSPRGSTKEMRQNWFRQVAAWGVNTVFSVNEGWDVRLIESNGNGTEIYEAIIKQCNESFMIGLVGNLQQVQGSQGFSGMDLTASVRQDLIEDVSIPLAYTLATQVLPPYTFDLFPEEFEDSPGFEYEVKKPSDLSAEAAIYTALGAGLEALQNAASLAGLEINVQNEFKKFGILSQPISEEQRVRIREAISAGMLKGAPEEAQRTAAVLYSLGKALHDRAAGRIAA